MVEPFLHSPRPDSALLPPSSSFDSKKKKSRRALDAHPMVQLAHIFKKDKDKDKDSTEKNKKTDESDSPGPSPRASFSTARKSPSKSPTKSPSKSSSKSPTKNRFSHSRSSSFTSAPTAPPFKFGTRSTKDQDSHPLNLPPDELRRRLSAMAASRDDQQTPMDIDPQETPKNNGANGEERSPTPPPHLSNSTSDEADTFKLAGNKFFKDGKYARAIEEYNKGMPFFFPLIARLFTSCVNFETFNR